MKRAEEKALGYAFQCTQRPDVKNGIGFEPEHQSVEEGIEKYGDAKRQTRIPRFGNVAADAEHNEKRNEAKHVVRGEEWKAAFDFIKEYVYKDR